MDDHDRYTTLTGVVRLVRDLDKDLERKAGVPLSHTAILDVLSNAPDGRLRMSELAEAVQTSRSRLTHTVDRLHDRDWVRRAECDSDRRGQWAQLTEAGFAAARTVAEHHTAIIREYVVDRISGAQFEQLLDIVQTLTDVPEGPS